MTVALVEDIRPGWHTYWVNPGEAGEPTEIQWTLPAGWKAGAIQWPYPKRIPTGPLMDYGYEGKPWLLVDITAPASAASGQPVTLKAECELARLQGSLHPRRCDAHFGNGRERVGGGALCNCRRTIRRCPRQTADAVALADRLSCRRPA